MQTQLRDHSSGNVFIGLARGGKKRGRRHPTEVPGDYIQRDVRQHVLHLLGHFGDAAVVCGQTLHHEAEAHGGGSGTWHSWREAWKKQSCNITLHVLSGLKYNDIIRDSSVVHVQPILQIPELSAGIWHILKGIFISLVYWKFIISPWKKAYCWNLTWWHTHLNYFFNLI